MFRPATEHYNTGILILRINFLTVVVAKIHNPRTWEAEAGDLKELQVILGS